MPTDDGSRRWHMATGSMPPKGRDGLHVGVPHRDAELVGHGRHQVALGTRPSDARILAKGTPVSASLEALLQDVPGEHLASDQELPDDRRRRTTDMHFLIGSEGSDAPVARFRR